MTQETRWLVTGGAGFIGSNFVLQARRQNLARVINLDKLTYAGNVQNLEALREDPMHRLVVGDICDQGLLDALLHEEKPDALIHFAAESHVDRSITEPTAFVQTNVLGTLQLLEASRRYLDENPDKRASFRFLHVSTDEVYGSLEPKDPAFTETKAYEPNSPYSASKAGSDHLVRAYYHTFDLPVLTTNCSNNYGPYQFPEKLIPLMIIKAMHGEPLPVYGDGLNVRDWLYVEDHVDGIVEVLKKGRLGETYNIGGSSELKNIDVVHSICSILDRLKPKAKGSYQDQISFVKDRPGHDRRYAVDTGKIKAELGWQPRQDFQSGIEKTVQWYLDNTAWWQAVQSGTYRGERLGLVNEKINSSMEV